MSAVVWPHEAREAVLRAMHDTEEGGPDDVLAALAPHVAVMIDQARAEAWYEGLHAAIDAVPGDYWCSDWDDVRNPYRADRVGGAS